MKLTAVLLLLVAVGVALAGPQRTSRRFTPSRSQDAEPVTADEATPEADLAEEEKPAQPRFRIAGRPSGSSFAPKRSSSADPTASSDDAPVEVSGAEPAPAPRAPVQISPSRPRTRGSRTFVESIKESNIPLEASQLEALEQSKQSLQRISSRPSSRPSSRVPTGQSAAPGPRKPSRPSSVRAPLQQPSTPTNAAEPEAIASNASPSASASKSSGGDQESRRQRLLALKKRPRAGAPSAAPQAEESKPEEEPAQAFSAPVEAAEVEMVEKKADTMQNKTSIPKLDEEVTQTLDETIKAEAKKGDGGIKKEITAKETVAEKDDEKRPEEAEPSASAVTPEPEASTTTTAAAPAARPRRINTLTKLRASRPVGGSNTGGTRPRTSATTAAGESPTKEFQPRLSSRSGGRGNSRGGAALATSTRVSRPSSRVLPSRTGATEGEEANADQLAAPAAGTTGSSGSFRRKLPPASRRRNQVPLSISPTAGHQTKHDESRVAGEEGRGPRTVRHSLPAREDSPNRPRAISEGRSTAPVRKQVGTEESTTRRAGVRSLIERLRGRKNIRMRIDEKQDVRGEVSEDNVKIKEQLKVINELPGSQPKSELVEMDNTNIAGSTTTSKPTTVIVATTQAVTKIEKTTAIASTTEVAIATAASLSPRNLPPALVKQRENSKRTDKRKPRGRVERRRRPINFSAVQVPTSLQLSSTTAEATTLPPPLSVTAETTTLLPPSSTTADTTTSPPPSSITVETTTFPPPSSTTAAETTTLPPPSSTTADTTRLTPPSSITAETTTFSPPSSTTAAAETTTLPPPASSTAAQTTTLPPPSSITAAQATPLPPQSTTAQTSPRLRRPLPAIERTTRKQQSTTRAPPTTLVATAKPPSPRTTTLSTTTPESARSAPSWKPRVAPEDPMDAFNRGGFRFQPHPSSESDITRRRGEVVLTEVGILEDTPSHQVAAILRGLGSRRRGLARPPSSKLTTTMQQETKDELSGRDYHYDDY